MVLLYIQQRIMYMYVMYTLNAVVVQCLGHGGQSLISSVSMSHQLGEQEVHTILWEASRVY